MQRSLLNVWRFAGDVWTIEQFNESHRRIVANAETHFQDTNVAAVTCCVTWAQFGEQLADDFTVTQAGKCQTLVGQCIGLAQCQDRLDDAAQFLGFWQGCFDGFVAQQGDCHVAQHRQTMRGSTIQFTETVTVTHDISFQITVLIQLFYRQCRVPRTGIDRFRLLPGFGAAWCCYGYMMAGHRKPVARPSCRITFPDRLVASFPASCPGSDHGMPELP